jgi:hypothetical protein
VFTADPLVHSSRDRLDLRQLRHISSILPSRSLATLHWVVTPADPCHVGLASKPSARIIISLGAELCLREAVRTASTRLIHPLRRSLESATQRTG